MKKRPKGCFLCLVASCTRISTRVKRGARFHSRRVTSPQRTNRTENTTVIAATSKSGDRLGNDPCCLTQAYNVSVTSAVERRTNRGATTPSMIVGG